MNNNFFVAKRNLNFLHYILLTCWLIAEAPLVLLLLVLLLLDGFRFKVLEWLIVIGKAGRIADWLIIEGLEYFRIRLQLLLMSLFFKLQFRLNFFIFLLAASANFVSLVLLLE